MTLLTANLSLTNISITPQFVIDPAGQYAYMPTEGTSYFSTPGSPDYHKIGGLDIYSITGGALVFYASQEVGHRRGLFQLHPSGQYAYLLGNLSYLAEANLITAFSINSGILTSIETISVSQLSNNSSFYKAQIDPTGKNLFVLTSANQIAHIAIDPVTGLFNSTPEIITPTAGPISIAFHPSGQMAYITERGNGSGIIDLYSINPTSNVVTFVKSIDIPSGLIGGIIPQFSIPGGIVVDPSGKFAYILDTNNWDILIYQIEANGDLTKLSTEISTGPHPHDMVVWGK